MAVDLAYEPFLMSPIGYVRTGMINKFQTPHQPTDPSAKPGVIELYEGHNFEAALQDLGGFEYVWLIWVTHKNLTWRPKVLPPRGAAQRRGVFATRSPHRPNPIGLTAVKLLSIKGRTLTIGECDLIDGTPILDIKPYIPFVDSFPEARYGWLQEIEEELQAPARFTIKVGELANRQLTWLKEIWNVEFLTRATQLLERDPTPHRTRRITRFGKDKFRMGCGPWRIIFEIEHDTVTLLSIEPGYPLQSLDKDGSECVIDRDAQKAFYEYWNKELSTPHE